jgi:hypothetical protein
MGTCQIDSHPEGGGARPIKAGAETPFGNLPARFSPRCFRAGQFRWQYCSTWNISGMASRFRTVPRGTKQRGSALELSQQRPNRDLSSHSPQIASKFTQNPRDFSTDRPFLPPIARPTASKPQPLTPQPLPLHPPLAPPVAFHSFVPFSTALRPTPFLPFPLV